jgi:hypothetical protein
VPLALAAVLRVAEARSPESRRRTRPPPAILRRRRHPGVLPVEFAVSSPSSRCDSRDKWGTLAPHLPRAAERRRSPPVIATARACATPGPPDPQPTALICSRAGQPVHTGQPAAARARLRSRPLDRDPTDRICSPPVRPA